MVVFLHVVIAVASIGVASFSFFRPSTLSLRINYGFIGATVTSGMYLVVISPAHMLEACLMGIGYLAVVLAVTILARLRLVQLAKRV